MVDCSRFNSLGARCVVRSRERELNVANNSIVMIINNKENTLG